MGDGLHFSLQQCGSITQLPPIGLHSEPLPPTLPSLAMGRLAAWILVVVLHLERQIKHNEMNFQKYKLYSHGICFLIGLDIHDIPLSTTTFMAAISSSRPTRLYFAPEDPAWKSSARPVSNIGSRKVLPSIFFLLKTISSNMPWVQGNVFNRKNYM